MALRMPQPWKHPKTGIYHFRRAVPKDLWTVIGKREEKKSLGTKDPQIAKRRFAEVLAQCEDRWASLRAGARRLTEREAHELAAGLHDRWLQIYGDNPTLQLSWRPEWFDRLWSEPDPQESEDGPPASIGIDQVVIPAMRRYCNKQTQFLIENRGLNPDEWGYFLLQRAVAAALQRASLTLRGVAEGTLDPKTLASMMSALGPATNEGMKPSPVSNSPTASSLISLVDLWWKEAAGKKPNTYQSYRGTLRSFAAFVSHKGPACISAKDVIAFKDFRLSTVSAKTGRLPSAKTVKDSDLSALKAIFGWAVANQLMTENPAAGITIKLGRRPKLRSKGFTDAEARLILHAALTHVSHAETAATAAAKRWVPWLCAFTGARVGEMAQLRKEDVRLESEFWVIHVTPEAGTVKTNEARDIVLHRQLVGQGFPEFVANSKEGHLFLRLSKTGDALGPLQGLTNRLAEFSRSVVTDKNVQPNHGWRHRFKTVGREAGIDSYVLDAIQGHAPRTEGEGYGNLNVRIIASAIDRIPDVDVDTKAG